MLKKLFATSREEQRSTESDKKQTTTTKKTVTKVHARIFV